MDKDEGKDIKEKFTESRKSLYKRKEQRYGPFSSLCLGKY
jgi:hypothetical protein